MITSKELMIGDWYVFQGHPYKCTASDIAALAECEENGMPTDISEIPLTAEILEKNGFEKGTYELPVSGKKIPKYSYAEVEGDIKEVALLPLTMNSTWSFGAVDGTHIPVLQFVHQLQHALRHCGIEHEIKL